MEEDSCSSDSDVYSEDEILSLVGIRERPKNHATSTPIDFARLIEETPIWIVGDEVQCDTDADDRVLEEHFEAPLDDAIKDTTEDSNLDSDNRDAYEEINGAVNEIQPEVPDVLMNPDEPETNVDTRVRRSKRKGKPLESKKFKNKQLRMQGKDYVGYSKAPGEKAEHSTKRRAREMGPTCNSKACKSSKERFCQDFSEEIRKGIFKKFWGEMSWDQRKVFVSSHVDYIETKRHTSAADESRRGGTYKYSLHLGSIRKPVCKTMFLNTCSLGSWSVQQWAKNDYGMSASSDSINTSRRESQEERGHSKEQSRVKKRDTVKTFLDSLAKLPSHYCRKDSNKLYLEPDMFRNKTDLYRVYKDYCKSTNQDNIVSRFTFQDIVDTENIAIFLPKKDQCDVCCEHSVQNLSDEAWAEHIKKKDRARAEKANDKLLAEAGECKIFTMDLQAVKLSPLLKASALYYKTKLCVHNFTIFNLGNKHTVNYIWNEAEGELVASVFASCVTSYLHEYHSEDKRPIILYSDGCTYQNRNAIMANALLHYSVENNVNITQKYLEKGHTQMECDSVHAALEKKLKNRDIYLPTDYIAVSNEARTSTHPAGPYVTKYLYHDFFKDFSEKSKMVYTSIRPGNVAKDPTVTNLRAIQYTSCGKIEIKLDFDDDWQPLPRRPNAMGQMPVTFPRLYAKQLNIPSTKYDHLQQLKSVLPQHCHAFYDNLSKK